MRLRDVCSVQIGYTARSRLEPAPEGVPVIQLRDLTQGGAADPDQLARVHLAEPSERYAVSAGDVLFRSRGDLNLAVALDERFVAHEFHEMRAAGRANRLHVAGFEGALDLLVQIIAISHDDDARVRDRLVQRQGATEHHHGQ